MQKKTKELDATVRLPPYIPWRTFENYLATLKSATVPHTLDGSVRPHGMAGGMWRQLLSALRFLGLTTEGNVVSSQLESLVESHGSDQWASAVKEYILPSYDDIVDNLPIERATSAQLASRFKQGSNADGQMLEKCVRFYVHALRESGTKHSTLFTLRDKGNGTPQKRRARKQRTNEAPHKPSTTVEHKTDSTHGMIDFPIPIGNSSSFIRIPRNITNEQFPMVKAMINAVETLANQNSQKESNATG